jgi:3-oxoacyl-[acyl-carrier protein] reductase
MPPACYPPGMHTVISGAGSGIGRAIALRLARDGHDVSLLGRSLANLHETARLAGRGRVVPCDLADRASIDAAFADAGRIDAFVANAGIGGPNAAGPGDRFDELVAVDLVGTYHSLRAAQTHLPEHGGSLVVVSSILARFGVPGYTGYCAAKAGLLGLVRALALELAPRHQVNALTPGWVDTAMAREGIAGMAAAMGVTEDEAYERAMRQVPRGRMSSPAEIAGVVAWLLGPDAVGVTGQAIDVNGGAWMG